MTVITIKTAQEKGKKKVVLLLAGILWITVLGIGFTKFYNYEFKAGTTGYIAQQWPRETIIPRHNNIYQLIMFVHPQCPCSKASLGELESIMTHGQGKVRADVVFAKPKDFKEKDVKSDLFRHASKIPGVEVMIDEEGKQAALFGGTTSGQTFLYAPQGQLIFSGGITASRGHLGENAGENTILALINGGSAQIKSTPFFGCLLHDKPVDMITPARRLQ